MDAIGVETLAFVLMAASLPLISVGSIGGVAALWIAGFGLLVVATALPPALRYTDASRAA